MKKPKPEPKPRKPDLIDRLRARIAELEAAHTVAAAQALAKPNWPPADERITALEKELAAEKEYSKDRDARVEELESEKAGLETELTEAREEAEAAESLKDAAEGAIKWAKQAVWPAFPPAEIQALEAELEL